MARIVNIIFFPVNFFFSCSKLFNQFPEVPYNFDYELQDTVRRIQRDEPQFLQAKKRDEHKSAAHSVFMSSKTTESWKTKYELMSWFAKFDPLTRILEIKDAQERLVFEGAFPKTIRCTSVYVSLKFKSPKSAPFNNLREGVVGQEKTRMIQETALKMDFTTTDELLLVEELKDARTYFETVPLTIVMFQVFPVDRSFTQNYEMALTEVNVIGGTLSATNVSLRAGNDASWLEVKDISGVKAKAVFTMPSGLQRMTYFCPPLAEHGACKALGYWPGESETVASFKVVEGNDPQATQNSLPSAAQTSRGAMLNAVPLLQEIQKLSQLVTIKYFLQKPVGLEKPTESALGKMFAGQNRVVVLVQGVVKAGVNLQRIQPGALTVENTKLSLTLPLAEITDVYIDDQKTEVLESSTGLFRPFTSQLGQAIRVQALEDLRRAARNNGILKEADDRAREQLKRLFELLGFTEVEFRVP